MCVYIDVERNCAVRNFHSIKKEEKNNILLFNNYLNDFYHFFIAVRLFSQTLIIQF